MVSFQQVPPLTLLAACSGLTKKLSKKGRPWFAIITDDSSATDRENRARSLPGHNQGEHIDAQLPSEALDAILNGKVQPLGNSAKKPSHVEYSDVATCVAMKPPKFFELGSHAELEHSKAKP